MILDALVVVYIAFAVWRGRKRGLTAELPGAFSITIFAVCGWGLFTIMYRGLTQASMWIGTTGVVSFFGILAGSFFLWRHLRGRVRWVAQRWPEERQQRLGGALAGGVRALVLSGVVLMIFAYGPTRFIVKSSRYGRALIQWVLPVYEKAHSR